MKSVLFSVIILLIAQTALGAERLVDEKTLTSWGYKTLSIDESQIIRKIERIEVSGKVYYPRFYLSKKCFGSSSLAKQTIEEIVSLQKADTVQRDFDYRQGFVLGACVFLIDTHSLMFKLDYQQGVFEQFEKYVKNKSGS